MKGLYEEIISDNIMKGLHKGPISYNPVILGLYKGIISYNTVMKGFWVKTLYTLYMSTTGTFLSLECKAIEAQAVSTGLTSVAVVQVGEFVPLVVLNEAEQRPFNVRPHLEDELLLSVQREAGCDEGDVQCPTERRYRVHRLLIVESENGVNPSGELRTD